MDDARDPTDIEIEAPEGDEPDEEEVAVEVERILIRDEARVMSAVSVGLMAIGSVFAVCWLSLAWRIEHDLDLSNNVIGGAGNPDVVDRIVALEQVGGVLMLFLLVLAAGCGLRLYASSVFTAREE